VKIYENIVLLQSKNEYYTAFATRFINRKKTKANLKFNFGFIKQR
jgi:hypothetical protein